uniref:Aminoglycoside adenylyltransferase n=2 Tax=Bacteria TaxID=2 RepID=H2B2M9_UNCXX|nr:aminoglycoside adenylyltransferase [bacterium AK-MB29]
MGEFFPAQVFKQLSHARAVIERHLAATLDTIHLFGSAIDGGLKPDSDIDLLVTVSAAPNDSLRQALMLDLLKVSSPPGDGGTWRPLELTVVARSEVVPWRYPARRELQFGEWLARHLSERSSLPSGSRSAILLTKARQHSLALLGPSAATFFEPVPKEHFSKALFDTIAQWNAESDWKGDERNVVLALARIWYSASTGLIAPKDVAAAWVSERLPAKHRPLICKARAAYLGSEDDDLQCASKRRPRSFDMPKQRLRESCVERHVRKVHRPAPRASDA